MTQEVKKILTPLGRKPLFKHFSNDDTPSQKFQLQENTYPIRILKGTKHPLRRKQLRERTIIGQDFV